MGLEDGGTSDRRFREKTVKYSTSDQAVPAEWAEADV